VHTQMNPTPAPMVTSKITNVTGVMDNTTIHDDTSDASHSTDPVNAALAVFQSILNDSSWKDGQAEEGRRGAESGTAGLWSEHHQRDVVREVC
jgi:hypothetical protein